MGRQQSWSGTFQVPPESGSKSTSVWESHDNPYFSGLCLRLPLTAPPPPPARGFPCLRRLQPHSLTGHMVQPALCGRGQGGRGGSEWQPGCLPWQRAWLLV